VKHTLTANCNFRANFNSAQHLSCISVYKIIDAISLFGHSRKDSANESSLCTDIHRKEDHGMPNKGEKYLLRKMKGKDKCTARRTRSQELARFATHLGPLSNYQDFALCGHFMPPIASDTGTLSTCRGADQNPFPIAKQRERRAI
jgi:hypothetical protein